MKIFSWFNYRKDNIFLYFVCRVPDRYDTIYLFPFHAIFEYTKLYCYMFDS